MYIIERSYPNGNVFRVERKKAKRGKWFWYPQDCYCYHTEEPHATDDILLSQKLVLENDEVEFLREANRTQPPLGGKQPLHMTKRSV